jgi:hypothetical protein
MKTYSPEFIIGDSISLPILWQDSDEVGISFINRKVRIVVREYISDNDNLVLVDLNSDDHSDLVNILEKNDSTKIGKLEILIPSSTTQSFPVGDLPYNIEVTDLDGFVRTILRGRLKMISDIAR